MLGYQQSKFMFIFLTNNASEIDIDLLSISCLQLICYLLEHLKLILFLLTVIYDQKE